MLNEVRIRQLRRKKFSLILSGGASLGLAHIGTLKWLEENHLVPNEIVGTSMGSIIGSLFSIGFNSREIFNIVKVLQDVDLFKMKFTHGKIEYEQVNKALKGIFKNKKISDGKIPLKIIATDAMTGSPRAFDNSSEFLLRDIIRASISIPGLFDASKVGNKMYIDGGVSSNLGIEFANKKNIKIASNVVNRYSRVKYKEPKGILSDLKGRFAVVQAAVHYFLINQTYSKVPFTKKLVMIEPDLSKFPIYKLGDYEKMIEITYEEAKKKIN